MIESAESSSHTTKASKVTSKEWVATKVIFETARAEEGSEYFLWIMHV